jgi:hypothetical protein
MYKHPSSDYHTGEFAKRGLRELTKDCTNWRMMLIGASCLLGVELSASPSSACLGCSPQPPTLPWQVQYATKSCTAGGLPGPFEVFIFDDAIDPNRRLNGGNCTVLTPGLYPHDTNMGIRNDSMSAIKVGPNVRARVFYDGTYGGQPQLFPKNSSTLDFVKIFWNDVASSMRVELANRDVNCQDVRSGEIALFTEVNFQGDCVILPVHSDDGSLNEFATPESMGIANDTTRSMFTFGSDCDVLVFDDAYFRGSPHRLSAGTTFQNMIKLGGGHVSSLKFECPQSASH